MNHKNYYSLQPMMEHNNYCNYEHICILIYYDSRYYNNGTRLWITIILMELDYDKMMLTIGDYMGTTIIIIICNRI